MGVGRHAAEGLDDAPEPNPVEPPAAPVSQAFPSVGIGASARDSLAFEVFLSGMPADSDPGMASVLVRHLAPNHESILAELIRRHTRTRVFEVEEGRVGEPNSACVIPPNRDTALLKGA